mgnify:FL=1
MTTQSQQTKPEWFAGSEPEWLLYTAFIRLGRQPNVDFIYQSIKFGGPTIIGGRTLDFEFFDPPNLAVNVQGVYYHYELGSGIRQNDVLLRQLVASTGKTLIFVDEDDILEDAMYYASEALQFKDHSRLGTD